MLTASITNSFEEDVGSITYKVQNSFSCFLLFNPIMLQLMLHFGSGFNTAPDSQVRRSAMMPLRLRGMMNLAYKFGLTRGYNANVKYGAQLKTRTVHRRDFSHMCPPYAL
jgi:hypothetical protein